MTFDPQKYLINLENNPNKPARMYLKPVHRVKWFRDVHPNGKIVPELVNMESIIVMRCTIMDEHGQVLSVGYGSAQMGTNAVWKGREIEKAETAAIGRALSHAGFGTEFSDDDDDDHLADSPAQKPYAPTSTPRPQPTPPPAQNDPAQQIEAYLDDHGITPEQARNALGIKSWAAFPSFEVARKKIDEKLLDSPASKPQPSGDKLQKTEIPF